MDSSHVEGQSGTQRSSRGCWTCRLRRKKCDEVHPVCGICNSLQITCNYSSEKPDWMDGGPKQEAKVQQLKLNVKEQAHRRRTERILHDSNDTARAQDSSQNRVTKAMSVISLTRNGHEEGPRPSADTLDADGENSEDRFLTSSETFLVTFYTDYLFPFLFPFYQPSLLQGAKLWITDLILNNWGLRKAALCQSAYFYELLQGSSHDDDHAWENGLAENMRTLTGLRGILQATQELGTVSRLESSIHLMVMKLQVQRFAITVLSFDDCKFQHDAVLTLFIQSFAFSTASGSPACVTSQYEWMMDLLRQPSSTAQAGLPEVPSSESAAFKFACTVILFEDIIVSTATQEQPVLYSYHRGLLCSVRGSPPLVNLEAVVGCQNWAMVLIAEIAVLDAWKQQTKTAGSLDVMELVQRAGAIKDLLGVHLMQLEKGINIASAEHDSDPFDIFPSEYELRREKSSRQTSLVTRIWAHAALLYLFVVVSGWQPASTDVRYHVRQILHLLTHDLAPRPLLRTVVWPFCVAGCLAEPVEQAHFRELVEALQPPDVFGTLRKALEIMENVWREKNEVDASGRDLAMCFQSLGDFVLLV